MKTLDVTISILKQAVYFTPLLLLLAVNPCPAAAWEGSDDFSSGLTPANWPIIKQMNTGQMTVAGTNGHASFLVLPSSTAKQNAYIVWRGNPTAAEDWTVDITCRNSAAYSANGGSQLQLAVLRTDGAGTSNQQGYRISLSQGSLGYNGPQFIVKQWVGMGTGMDITRATNITTSVLSGLRLVYHSASGIIEAWFDPDANGLGWTKLDTISLADFSASMTATNTFMFAILGATYYGPISEGQIWADNFRITGNLPMPPALVVADAQRLAGSVSLHLTWTNNGSQCVLQNAGAVTGSWSTVVTPWSTNAGWVSTTVSNSSPAQFYRLRQN